MDSNNPTITYEKIGKYEFVLNTIILSEIQDGFYVVYGEFCKPKSVDIFTAGVSDGCLEIEVYPKPEDCRGVEDSDGICALRLMIKHKVFEGDQSFVTFYDFTGRGTFVVFVIDYNLYSRMLDEHRVFKVDDLKF